MKNISRPFLYILVAVLVLAAISAFMAYGPFGAGSHSIVMFDEDISDSALGWMIAIPVMIIVGILVGAVMAGVVVVTGFALAFAAIMVILGMLLAFTPVLLFLAIPVLAIYGLVKLFQRDERQIARSV